MQGLGRSLPSIALSFVGSIALYWLTPLTPATGQITPDDTLGAEGSQVTSPVPGGFQIDGGATRGTNLFHSFLEFSVPTDGFAYFNNELNIQNIMTRVTGASVSNIDGLLRANGTANVFLINPNGIIFGPNASLDVGGSFVASTASAVTFPNGIEFSATNPQAPPLLTISVPLGLQYGSNPGNVSVQGSFLQVPNGRTLALVGGDVSLDDAYLLARGGRVELGSAAGTSTVELNGDGSNLSLSFPRDVAFADISLTNGAFVNVQASGGGSIAINAQNFSMEGKSLLAAGITSGSASSIAGDIEIKATEAVNLTDESLIRNDVLPRSRGQGGNINITTRLLRVSDGAGVIVTTLDQGKGGSLIVNASESVQLMGTSADGQLPSRLRARTTGKGDGGNIEITTPRLLVTDGAGVSVTNFDQGKAGSLIVNASESVQLMGTSADGQIPSGLVAQTQGKGDGGNIEITTPQLLVTDGAQVDATNFDQGKGGSLIVNASESVQLMGTSADGQSPSGLFAQAQGKGDGGNIEITTPQLLVTDGAQVNLATRDQGKGGSLIVNASESVQLMGTSANGRIPSGLVAQTQGKGDGGNIEITTPWLLVTDGAQVNLSTGDQGKAGSLIVNASESVQLMGTSADGQFPSRLRAGTTGKGDGGNIEITTPWLLVTDGAQVNATTRGEGKGGTLIVNASESVQLMGTSADGQSPSGLGVGTTGKGDGGNIEITTPQLLVTDGAQVTANTRGEGKGGTLIVNASESVQLMGTSADGQIPSGLGVGTTGKGDGGNIEITTPWLLVTDGAQVNATNFDQGKAGSLIVNASESVQVMGTSADGQSPSGLVAQTQGKGDGGNIEITTPQLLVTDGAQVNATTRGEGKGGTLIVNASEQVQLSGAGGLFVNATAGGTAGELIVKTNEMSVRDGAQVNVSSPQGQAGNLNITANSLTLNRGTLSAVTGTSGAEGGANITLKGLEFLRMDNESLISASALGNANGGNVTIDSTLIVATPPIGPKGSDITANAEQGNGGRVNVTTQGLFGIEFRPELTPKNDITVSSTFGLSGEFALNTPGVDPSRGLTNLPAEFADASNQITQNCPPRGSQQESSFTITGAGGLPPRPGDAFDSPYPTGTVRSLPEAQGRQSSTNNSQVNSPPAPKASPAPLVEASGWRYGANGEVILTAQAPTFTPHGSWSTPPTCH